MNLSDLPISRLSVEDTGIDSGAYYAAQSGDNPAIITKCLVKNKYDISPTDAMYNTYKKKECFKLQVTSTVSINALIAKCKADYLDWMVECRVSGKNTIGESKVDLNRLSEKFTVKP